jgi:hypothetical protein
VVKAESKLHLICLGLSLKKKKHDKGRNPSMKYSVHAAYGSDTEEQIVTEAHSNNIPIHIRKPYLYNSDAICRHDQTQREDL